MPDERGHRWWARLPFFLVLLSLLALALVPWLIERRVAALRDVLAEVVEPARDLTTQIQLALAIETAGTRGYLLTGEATYAETHQQARAERRRHLAQLDELSVRLDPRIRAEVTTLADELRDADRLLDALYDGRIPRDEYIGYLGEQQARFQRVTAGITRIYGLIGEQAAVLEARSRALDRLGIIATVILVGLALVAASLVARLGTQYRKAAERLERRARRQTALADLASRLAEVATRDEALETAIVHARAFLRATGAYVECLEDEGRPGGRVEIVAAAGTDTPAPGSRLVETDSLVRAADPSGSVLRTFTGPDRERIEDAPADARGAWPTLVVPIVPGGTVIGALVLRRSPGQTPFTRDSSNHARTVGALISTAIRRIELLAELRGSERRFRQIAEHLDEVIWLSDPRLEIAYYVNPAFERVWGRGRESFYRDPRSPLEDVHPEDADRVAAVFSEPVSDDIDIEFRIVPADGEVRWIRSRIHPIRDREGGVYRIAGISEDITAQRGAEAERERLLAREQRAREQVSTILESITDAFFAVDTEWRFTYINHQAERVLQRSREELLGRNVWELFPGAIGEVFDREYHRAAEERRTVAFEAYYAPLEIWVDVRAYPSAEGLSVIFRDVTARKRAEAELRTRIGQLDGLASLGQCALVEPDVDALLGMASEMVADNLAVDYVECLELRPDGDTLLLRAGWGWPEGLVGEAEVSAGRASMAGYTLLSEEPVLVHDLTEETRFEGSWLLKEHAVCSGISVVIHGRHRPWGALGGYTRAERSFSEDDIFFLQSVSNILSQAIELRRAEADRERLMRGFSHDVKNPLGAADGYLQLLEEGVVESMTPRQAESVSSARRSIRSALGLIEDLLDLARAEAGEIELRIAPVDMGAVVRDTARDHRAQAEAKGLDFALEVPADLPPLESDERRIRQIIGNLLSNAVKYTDHGRIRVRVTFDQDTPIPGRAIGVHVSDTGAGISQADLNRVFDEFQRLAAGATTEGAGIGLAISQRIARALGGEIAVESELGRGTTFTLWLPVGRADPRKT